MNLAIDVGNTCSKLVAFDNDVVVDELRVDHDKWDAIPTFCSNHPFEKGICSSVVALPTDKLALLDSLPFSVMMLKSGLTPAPIANKYSTPDTLGTDRLAAAVGAHAKAGGRTALVIDVGTCITYDLVTAAGEYLGGNISPGPTMRLRALNAFTDKLPLVERKGDTPLLGSSTETAIRSGVMRGMEHEINGYIDEFSNKYPDLLVYLTGGIQLNLHSSKKNGIFADSFIVPYGLNKILQYNEDISKCNE